MRKILIPLLLLAFLACKKEAETPVDYAIISGKILNNKGKLSINSYDRTFSKPLKFGPDGTFVDTLTVEKRTYVLFDGTNPVFLHIEPGYDLQVSYDANDFGNSLVFSGKGAVENTYVKTKTDKEKELLGNRFETYKMAEAEFKAKYSELKASNLALMNDFDGLSDAFVNLEKRDIEYNYLNKLNEYEMYHRYVTKNDTFNVSTGFLKELEGLDYTNEEDFQFSPNYKALVTSKYRKEAEQLAKADSVENDIAYLKTLGKIENPLIKNELLFLVANQGIGYSKDIETFYKLFTEYSTNEAYNEQIAKKYHKIAGLSKGKPSPKFTNYENYAGGTTSLDDLKGKYVYIDVWATWCGPCKREIPYLKEVEKKFHGKNIEFVSISIDKQKDHDKWQAMIKEKELGGMQLFADSDWKSKFITDYEIQGIPRFILIDPSGNIVDSNAPRPSNPALTTLFSDLNI